MKTKKITQEVALRTQKEKELLFHALDRVLKGETKTFKSGVWHYILCGANHCDGGIVIDRSLESLGVSYLDDMAIKTQTPDGTTHWAERRTLVNELLKYAKNNGGIKCTN